jgi:cytoskeletal protein CcmA (bactofilin family)
MPPGKAARHIEPQTRVASSGVNSQTATSLSSARTSEAAGASAGLKPQSAFHFPVRVPVIVGEATYRGVVPVDGLLSGQLNGNGGALSIKQRTRNRSSGSTPELDGEIRFQGIVRVNGHIAGSVCSENGTLIVSEYAIVDAHIDVGAAVINGTVNGDIIGHERVELGPTAIINGNISSPALTVRPGALFRGACRMLKTRGDSQ